MAKRKFASIKWCRNYRYSVDKWLKYHLQKSNCDRWNKDRCEKEQDEDEKDS